MGSAVLAPGFGANGNQPLLVALADLLEARGIATRRVSFPSRRPSPEYAAELEVLRAAMQGLARGKRPVALVGRSFGGRMCTLLAEQTPPAALVVLGYPIRPPGKRRARDEQALARVECPTLIVQGERDELGPLSVLEELQRANPRIEIRVIPGAAHGYGRREREALTAAADWLADVLSAVTKRRPLRKPRASRA